MYACLAHVHLFQYSFNLKLKYIFLYSTRFILYSILVKLKKYNVANNIWRGIKFLQILLIRYATIKYYFYETNKNSLNRNESMSGFFIYLTLRSCVNTFNSPELNNIHIIMNAQVQERIARFNYFYY